MKGAWHPAVFLVLWTAFAVLLQALSITGLAVAGLLLLPLALRLAGDGTRKLLSRTRWLLLTIAVLFAFATPGERLPALAGDVGMTWDGVHQGIEHVLRLVLLLAGLALLHRTLGTDGIMAGLHWLLAPLARWRDLRQRIVVRLMLVLDQVENTPGDWRGWLAEGDVTGVDRLPLAAGAASVRDRLVIALVVTVVLAAIFRP